jgi:hypothetical protein
MTAIIKKVVRPSDRQALKQADGVLPAADPLALGPELKGRGEPGQQYVLVDARTGKLIRPVKVERQGSKLLIWLEGEPVLELPEFFYGSWDYPAQLFMAGATEGAPGFSVSSDLIGEGQATQLLFAGASGPVAASSAAIWTPGAVSAPMGGAGLAAWPAAVLGGAAALAGAAGGKSEPNATTTPSSTLAGQFMAGPAVSGHGLRVEIWDLSGRKLGEALVGADGRYSVNLGSYTGGVIAKVFDASVGADFMDEATGQGKDLNAVFLAVGAITVGGVSATLHVNPATTLAAILAGLSPTDGSGTIAGSSSAQMLATIESANATVARLIGQTGSVTSAVVVPTINADGSANASPNGLGKFFAALSGVDELGGGDMVASLGLIASGITGSGDAARFSQAAQAALLNGAVRAGVDPADIARLIEPTAAAVAANLDLTQVQAAQGLTPVVAVQLSTAQLAPLPNLAAVAAPTLTVLSGPQLRSLSPSAVATLSASQVATLTEHQLGALTSEQLAAMAQAGGFASLSQAQRASLSSLVFVSGSAGLVAENANVSDVIYTAGLLNSPLAQSARYALKPTGDAALLDIDAATGAVTLKNSADYESKASYSFTVVATNTGGGTTLSTEKAVSVSVTDVNDVAPVFSSGNTGSVLENAATRTAIYTAASSDADGTAANRAVSYSLKAGTGDVALLDIDAATGAVTLKNSADYENKASYSFTVVATNTGSG